MHHIHAFTIHVVALILIKGVLFARHSRLIADKSNLGYRFPCDGPGRGGTCQVSSWDHTFLALFWMYNAISIVIFHFSWKQQSEVWGTGRPMLVQHISYGDFSQASLTIDGWLRDFLWSSYVWAPTLLRFCYHITLDASLRTFHLGILTDVPLLGSWLLARAYRIYSVGPLYSAPCS